MPFDAIVESSDPVLDSPGEPIEFGADIVQWPYPRFFFGNYNTICVSKQSNGHLVAYEMKLTEFASWEGYPCADLGVADTITSIDFADFGLFYSLCTNNAVYLRNVMLTNETVDRDVFGLNLVEPGSAPLYTAACNFHGQAVVANLAAWQGVGRNAIAWSGIKNYEFDPLVDKSAGWDILLANDNSGDILTVHALRPLESDVISYTDHGIFALTPRISGDVYTYSLEQLMGLGVAAKTHIGGDHSIHGFIDLNNEFWKVENNGQKFTKSGFREEIEELRSTDTEIIVSYHKPRREFYVSNGVISLIINDYGTCTVHQAVSSVAVGWDGRSYGTFRDFGDIEARVVVDTTDFGTRGVKTLESLLVGVEHDPEVQVLLGSFWRKSGTEEFRNSPRWVNGGPRGEGRVGITAPEFRMGVRANNYVNTKIQTIRANVKFPDARFRRGLGSSAQSVVNENTQGA